MWALKTGSPTWFSLREGPLILTKNDDYSTPGESAEEEK